MTDIPDVIDQLVGITPASKLHALRIQRTQARDNAQASYLALFKTTELVEVTMPERVALAVFIAGLHRETSIADFYAAGAAIPAALTPEIAAALTQGPYGHYPAGPLSSEDTDGLIYRVSDAGRAALGARLAAAMEHTHMLVFHPRDAAPEALQKLLDAGWSTTGIVTISQLVAFLSFQIRVISGLRSLAAA